MTAKIKKINIILMLLLVNFIAIGQDGVISQPQYSLFYTNPAFVGTYEGGRLSSFHRQQWLLTESVFAQSGVGYDQSLSLYNSGFGVYLYNNINGAVISPAAMFSFAYKFKLSRETIISLGLQGGVCQRYLNTSSLIFPDDIDDNGIPTGEVVKSGFNNIYSDFGFGALLLHKQFYLGLSAMHLNSPYVSKSENKESRVDIKASLQLGYAFELKKRRRGSHHFIMPYMMANYQGLQTNFMWGASMVYDYLLTGLFVRHGLANVDALILSAGFEKANIRAVYSYDINIGKKSSHMLGAHEITFTYLFYIKQKKKMQAVSCPHFLK